MKNSKKLTLYSMFIALVFIATFSIKIFLPATGGYLNLGDGVIYTIATVFGWQAGLIAGAIGSGLADLVAAPQWMLFTIIIKGSMGYIVGRFANRDKPYSIKSFMGIGFAIAIMVGGYYVAATIILGSHIVAFKEIPLNLLQSAFSIAVYIPLVTIVKKASAKLV